MLPFAQRFRFIGGTRLLSVAKVVKTFGDFLDTSETLDEFRYFSVFCLAAQVVQHLEDTVEVGHSRTVTI